MIFLTQSERKKMIESTIVICQAGGCVFTKEQIDDYEKVKRGEMTMSEIDQKLMTELDTLKKEYPEKFERR